MNLGVWILFLVETGESRTPNADHSVSAALRELSVCLARLADTLDWMDHTSKHNQTTNQLLDLTTKLICTNRVELKNR